MTYTILTLLIGIGTFQAIIHSSNPPSHPEECRKTSQGVLYKQPWWRSDLNFVLKQNKIETFLLQKKNLRISDEFH